MKFYFAKMDIPQRKAFGTRLNFYLVCGSFYRIHTPKAESIIAIKLYWNRTFSVRK